MEQHVVKVTTRGAKDKVEMAKRKAAMKNTSRWVDKSKNIMKEWIRSD